MSNYFVKSLFNICEADFKNLRKLYLPLIGPKPYSLIAIMYDLVLQKASKEKIELSKNDFLILSKQSAVEFDESKKILESFYLVDSYINKKNQDIVIELIQPLTEEKFFNNKILQTGLFSTFGNDNYQKWFIKNEKQEKQSCINNKEEYIKTSVKYIDYIDETSFYNTKNILEENRNSVISNNNSKNENSLGSGTFSFTNELEMSKRNFDPVFFLKQNTMCHITSDIEKDIESLINAFADSLTVEYIFNESSKLTKNLNWQYIKKIMEDLILKGKIKYFDVKNHFTSINPNFKNVRNSENTNKIQEADFELFSFYEPTEESNLDFVTPERPKNEN